MLGLLQTIAQAVAAIGSMVAYGVVTIFNAVMDAISAAAALAFTLLPSMPELAPLGAPEWLEWANWFFPFGTVLAMLGLGVVMYVGWLAVRWILKLARAA